MFSHLVWQCQMSIISLERWHAIYITSYSIWIHYFCDLVKQHCFPNAATVNMDSNLNVKELDSGASRRISSMSMLNKTASAGSILGRDKSPSKEQSAPLFGVPFHTVLPGNYITKYCSGGFWCIMHSTDLITGRGLNCLPYNISSYY